MKTVILLSTMIMTNQSITLFNFNKTSNITNWQVVDDVVMGGVSSGTFSINENGNGIFKGTVSLKNNGGFSSVKYRFKEIRTKEYSKIVLRVKGDGKNYQFRVKEKSSDSHSYITTFHTSKEWETIRIPLSELFPSFRGRKLDKPNYDKKAIEEIAFLIANKKAERFNLEIDSILLE